MFPFITKIDRKKQINFLLKLMASLLAAIVVLFVLLISLLAAGLGKDTEPPVISRPADITVYIGEGVSYGVNALEITDNRTKRKDIKVEVDDSEVDIEKEGVYKIVYTATDKAGNSSSAETDVYVLKERITLDMLNVKIAEVVEELEITEDMSVEQKCRKFYHYVQDNISYTGTSNKSDWIAAAYDALFRSKGGDCFSYFAAAKAFLEYLEIENLDVQRTPGFTEDTHFWSLVNIGTESSPRWYHFDCTRLAADEYNHSGCLLTQAQVDAYHKVRPNFRLYDKSKYPQIATRIIQATDTLNDLMD